MYYIIYSITKEYIECIKIFHLSVFAVIISAKLLQSYFRAYIELNSPFSSPNYEMASGVSKVLKLELVIGDITKESILERANNAP